MKMRLVIQTKTGPVVWENIAFPVAHDLEGAIRILDECRAKKPKGKFRLVRETQEIIQA